MNYIKRLSGRAASLLGFAVHLYIPKGDLMKRVLVLTLALMGLLTSCVDDDFAPPADKYILGLTGTPDFGEAPLEVKVQWVFGSGAVERKLTVSGPGLSLTEPVVAAGSRNFTFTTPGQYTVTLDAVGDSLEKERKSINITVVQPKRLLIVTKSGDGTGTVSSEDGKINCGSECGEFYPKSTSVKLTATPAADSVFAGWSSPDGAAECTGNNPQITVLVDKSKTCDAKFVKKTATQLLEFLTFKALAYRVESGAVSQNPTNAISTQAEVDKTLVLVGFDEPGKLEFLDFTDPKNPLPAYESIDFFCPGTRTVTFVNNASFNGPYFMAFSTSQRRACGNLIPPGFTQIFNLNYAPGAAAPVPGVSTVAVSDFERGQLDFISLGSNAPFPIPLSGSERSCPFSLVVPNQTTAYVVGREGVVGDSTENCNNWRKLFIVDIPSRTVETIDLGTKPREIALSPDGTTAYITDFEEDKVYVVDLVAKTLSKTLDVGDGPVGIALTPDGKLVIGLWNSNTVQLVDPASGDILDEKDSGGIHPARLLLADNGQTVIVPHFGSDGEPAQGTGVSFFKLNE